MRPNFEGTKPPVDASNQDTGYADFLREESVDGTIVGSRLPDKQQHIPLFDLDFECKLIPSRTPGHYHLYLGKPVSTYWYNQILNAFRAAGLIQPAWANHMIGEDGQTFLRLPTDPALIPEFAPKSRYKDPELETATQKSGAMLSD